MSTRVPTEASKNGLGMQKGQHVCICSSSHLSVSPNMFTVCMLTGSFFSVREVVQLAVSIRCGFFVEHFAILHLHLYFSMPFFLLNSAGGFV